ncbi:hypothetical protein EOE18_13920 [Novosphingobium umbonatum]|uniref:Uncharacterized protein n=1 Tax=Novosphingobium umbonatum TaxID=1908524 RepID=A0A437N1Y0_9SPHN|nr:hypothetical protein [Novosphingobium umbonatum]RVU03946.1 hypothetical protein EOE18_13920 [Novosphingobium umbonatum]
MTDQHNDHPSYHIGVMELRAMADKDKGVVTMAAGQVRYLANQIENSAATIQTLTRDVQNWKSQAFRDSYLDVVVQQRNEALAEVERLKLSAAEDRLTIADLAGAHGVACTQLTATQARLEEAVGIIRRVADRDTTAEAMAKPPVFAGIAPKERAKIIGERIHAQDMIVLNARAFLDQQKGQGNG